MKTTDEDNRIYEIWDVGIPPVSSRSLLYNLPPVGVGTSEVESLSGYISRLAQEHYLSPIVLLKNSVRDVSALPKGVLRNSINSAFAGSLNGFGTNTETITRILQSATHRNDIYLTSLLPWKGRLSNHKLLKKHSAWCPVCFDEQKEKRETVYEKLIWTFYDIKACLTHELPLVEQCPHCHKKLKALSGGSRPGYCSSCRKWLGSNLMLFDELRTFRNEEEKKKELWKAVKLGELLSEVPPLFIKEKDSRFVENLSGLIKILADGSVNDFAHMTGMWHMAVRRLLAGEVLPTIQMILKLCLPLRITPVQLFQKRDDTGFEIILEPPSIGKIVGGEDLKTYLNNFMEESPPPSASEVSRRTGWTTIRLQRNFPGEYKLIVENYTESRKRKIPALTDDETERILIDALKEKPPLSLQSVFRKMGCRSTGYRYYRRFPELCARIADRYKQSNLKKFNVGRAKSIIRQALVEKTPPSFSEVAGRIECTRENLRKKFPELSASLNERYKDYLEISRQDNLRQLHDEVKKALLNLQSGNKTISMNKVKKLLPRKWNDENFKKAYRSITDELNLKTEK